MIFIITKDSFYIIIYYHHKEDDNIIMRNLNSSKLSSKNVITSLVRSSLLMDFSTRPFAPYHQLFLRSC